MVVRCRFCGEKIKSNSEICEHCGKTLIKKAESAEAEGIRPVGLSSWEDKSVPAWVMYGVVGLGLLAVMLMFSRGCETPEKDAQSNLQLSDAVQSEIVPAEFSAKSD